MRQHGRGARSILVVTGIVHTLTNGRPEEVIGGIVHAVGFHVVGFLQLLFGFNCTELEQFVLEMLEPAVHAAERERTNQRVLQFAVVVDEYRRQVLVGIVRYADGRDALHELRLGIFQGQRTKMIADQRAQRNTRHGKDG